MHPLHANTYKQIDEHKNPQSLSKKAHRLKNPKPKFRKANTRPGRLVYKHTERERAVKLYYIYFVLGEQSLELGQFPKVAGEFAAALGEQHVAQPIEDQNAPHFVFICIFAVLWCMGRVLQAAHQLYRDDSLIICIT